MLDSRKIRNFRKTLDNMDLQTRKFGLIQAIINLQNDDLLKRMEAILTSDNIQTNPFSKEELNARIDLSMNDSKNDKLIELNDLLAEIEQWN